MADLPIDLRPDLATQLANALDIEGKIPHALDALGPVAGRDIVLVDGGSGALADRLAAMGSRVTPVGSVGPSPFAGPDASADAVIACWSAFRGAPDDQIAEAARLLRPGGRLLVVHDYGRDDVARLRGDLPEYGDWSRRDGPFLRKGFRIRVVHCWWTFTGLEEMRTFLREAFGDGARSVADRMTRPRLSYNVAIYHRTFGEAPA